MVHRTFPQETISRLQSVPNLRPLNKEERRILMALESMYGMSMATLDMDKIVENAAAMMKVEGLLWRLRNTGLVAPVYSTVKRCES